MFFGYETFSWNNGFPARFFCCFIHRFLRLKPCARNNSSIRTTFGCNVFKRISSLSQKASCQITSLEALVSVSHYLEYHSRVGDRFSSSGRIRCVQFPVVQFLKLGAGHSDGCILWQFNFTVQYKNQLIILLNCSILSLRSRVFHSSLILTQKTTSAKPFRDGRCGFFHGRILQQAPIFTPCKWSWGMQISFFRSPNAPSSWMERFILRGIPRLFVKFPRKFSLFSECLLTNHLFGRILQQTIFLSGHL